VNVIIAVVVGTIIAALTAAAGVATVLKRRKQQQPASVKGATGSPFDGDVTTAYAMASASATMPPVYPIPGASVHNTAAHPAAVFTTPSGHGSVRGGDITPLVPVVLRQDDGTGVTVFMSGLSSIRQ
jgi:hypothetical protein